MFSHVFSTLPQEHCRPLWNKLIPGYLLSWCAFWQCNRAIETKTWRTSCPRHCSTVYAASPRLRGKLGVGTHGSASQTWHLQHSWGFMKCMASRVMLNHFVQKIHWNFQSPSHGACLTSHKASNRHAGRAGEDRMGKRAHGETSAGGRQNGWTGIYCMMFLSLWRELFSHAQWVVPLNGKINVASMRISSYLVHVCSTGSKMLRACTSLFNSESNSLISRIVVLSLLSYGLWWEMVQR